MRIKLYRDRRRKHRWQLWSGSDIIAESGQGYRDRGDRDDMLCKALGGRLGTADDGKVHFYRFSGEALPVEVKA